MKQREYREKNNGNIEIKIKNGWLGTHFSIIPQYRFVRNLIKYLNTGLLGTTKNASLPAV
jgi:hypothetical protein